MDTENVNPQDKQGMPDKQKKTKAKKKRSVSLSVKLLASFAIFAVIILVVLWVIQAFFLNDIYSIVRTNELKKCANQLSDVADDDDGLDSLASDLAQQYSVCISIYSISDGQGDLVTSQHISAYCYIHSIHSDSLLNTLYTDAVDNGGMYMENIPVTNMFGGFGIGKRSRTETDEEFSIDDSQTDSSSDSSDTEQTDDIPDTESIQNAPDIELQITDWQPDQVTISEIVILSRVVRTADRDVLILLNTEMAPLNSTVKTLRVQLIIISVILVIVSALLTIIMTRSLTKPIKSMSSEAARLAMGNYDVNFDGGNCSETIQLSEALNGAALELSKLDKMQKDLIANISHDLRTPLTMISGYTEMMRDLPGEATPENLQIVIDETHRLTSLVNDMFSISKYQSGNITLNPSVFNITQSIKTTVERYNQLRETEGFHIYFEGGEEEIYVNADETKILQVLYNLINNAINYTGDDKTVIVRQSIVEEEDSVKFEVIDSGCGIPQESLPLVWERYYKVHDYHKRANMGNGLGLSIVKNILVLHNAEFGVTSKVGKGSDFWFKLKIYNPADDKNEEE